MAIAAIALTAILSLQQQMAASQLRHETALHRLALRRAAIVLIRDINPLSTPSGTATIAPGLTMEWTAETRVPPRRSIGFGGSDSEFSVGLYSVSVRLQDRDSKTVDQFRVERVGWQRSASQDAF
jgi:hypothetical protein